VTLGENRVLDEDWGHAMTTKLNPYLNFDGNAREAMEFYRSVFGGELNITTFGEMEATRNMAEQDKTVHSVLVTEHDLTLMAADQPDGAEHVVGSNVAMSLGGDDEQLLRGWFEKLSGSGSVTMPLEKAPWGDTFGQCVDRYGISWLVNIEAGGQPS